MREGGGGVPQGQMSGISSEAWLLIVCMWPFFKRRIHDVLQLHYVLPFWCWNPSLKIHVDLVVFSGMWWLIQAYWFGPQVSCFLRQTYIWVSHTIFTRLSGPLLSLTVCPLKNKCVPFFSLASHPSTQSQSKNIWEGFGQGHRSS